jgi:hypothetical protein
LSEGLNCQGGSLTRVEPLVTLNLRRRRLTLPELPSCAGSAKVDVLDWHPKRHLPLRLIFSALIALSLVLAPMASAWAALTMPADHVPTAAPTDDMAAGMSDCEKMRAPAKPKHCACCDTPAKAPCPDGAACLIKCCMQLLGILVPSSRDIIYGTTYDWPAEREKPPDRSLRPPARPPRV